MDIRLMRAGDIPSCVDIFYDSYNALHVANGFEEEDPAESDWLRAALDHFQSTDPSGARLAVRDGKPIAFGSSVRRDNYWFMPFLFVLPEAQGDGVGKTILSDMLPPDDVERATVVESFQPVSTGLYAAYGMVPRSVRFTLSGVSRLASLPTLAADVRRAPLDPADLAAINQLDRQILGYERPEDHAWWAASGATSSTLLRGDEVIAYVYEDDGYLSPALGVDEEALCMVIADTIRSADDPGGIEVPAYGSAGELIKMLMGAGAKFDAPKYRYLYCSSAGTLPASYVAFAGYLP